MDTTIGRIAYVDLGTGKVNIESIPEEDFRSFLGGRGLAAKIMLEKVKAGADPLSGENALILTTGPVTGTAVQGSDRTCVAAKSPLTGLLFNSSMGGRFGSTMKLAGFDALAIVGKAEQPKYLLVSKGDVEIHDAREFMGKSPKQVLTALSAEIKDLELCTVGIAGENLVRYANIVHPRLNGRHGIAGRGGLGAVMASKNLKAIAAQRGRGARVRVHSETLLKDVMEVIKTNINAPNAFTANLRSYGTASGPHMVNALGALGTRNLTEETFEHADRIAVYSDDRLKDVRYCRSVTCYHCSIACGKLCNPAGEELAIPEFESLYALGSMVGVDNLGSIVRANDLCNEYGMDTITMGVSIAFAIECFEKGIISKEEVGAYNLRFGDGDLIVNLIEDTARCQNLGNFLAKGTKYMSQVLGGESGRYAHQAKGLELAAHSARALKVLSIGYATGTRGGSHQDTRPRYGPGFTDYEGKVEQAIASQNMSAVGDSLTQCRFVMEAGCGVSFNDVYTDLLNAVTGQIQTPAELNEIGERIVNMERIFNVREGLLRGDDTLPYKVMYEEIPQGPLKGQRTPPEKLEELLESYYRLRGWDINGRPVREKLQRLSLESFSPS